MNIKRKHSKGPEKKIQAVGVFQILPRIELLIYRHVCACISTAAELEVEFF